MKNRSKKLNTQEYLFVDGYNIINSWEELKELSTIDLDAARSELIDIMAEYQSYTETKVIIVFDAHMVKKNSGKKDCINGVEVVYTKENETADHYIEKTLDEIGRIRKVRVATSDWMEQQVVLERGGTRVSARELKAEILSKKKYIINKRKRENEVNEQLIGGLDKENIEKLKRWSKS